jgi:small subunit ribosomal protein S17
VGDTINLLSKMERKVRKERVGVVTSNKMDKSGVIQVVRKVKHPKYGKFMLKTKKIMFHDENGDAGIGDTVKIMETKPLSKSKNWRLIEVLEKAK